MTPSTEIGNGKPKSEQALRGFGYVFQRGRIWWIAYWWRGQKIRESSRSGKRPGAVRLLKRRIQEIGKGRFIDPKAEERVTMSQLFDAVMTHYKNNNRRSTDTLQDRLPPLRAAFDLDRAVDVDEARIEEYKAARLASKRRGGKLQLLRVEPRPDAAHLHPMLHRGLDIAHDDANLAKIPEQPTHVALPALEFAAKRAEEIRYILRQRTAFLDPAKQEGRDWLRRKPIDREVVLFLRRNAGRLPGDELDPGGTLRPDRSEAQGQRANRAS